MYQNRTLSFTNNSVPVTVDDIRVTADNVRQASASAYAGHCQVIPDGFAENRQGLKGI